MQTDDNSIYALMKDEPEKGFRLLMTKFAEPVYWHIRRLVVSHADAQDAMQETFLKVFRSFNQLNDSSALKAWIYRIATREALNMIERNARPQALIERLDGRTEAAADEYIDYSDLEAVRLQRAIQTLPPKQRITFNLRYYDEMPYEEIARITESTPTAAKVNYHNAKERVVRCMKEHD